MVTNGIQTSYGMSGVCVCVCVRAHTRVHARERASVPYVTISATVNEMPIHFPFQPIKITFY